MQKLIFVFFILIPAFLFGEVKFENITIEKAIEKAASERKLIMIDIYTDWCVPCKELEKYIFQDSTISEFINNHFISLRINAEKNGGPDFCKKYQIPEAYPTVQFLTAKGDEIDRIVGLFDKSKYFGTIQDYANGRNTFVVLLEKYRKENNNSELAIQIGEKYSVRAKHEKALQYYLTAPKDGNQQSNHALWFKIASSYNRLEKYSEAQKALDKALELDPENKLYKMFKERLRKVEK